MPFNFHRAPVKGAMLKFTTDSWRGRIALLVHYTTILLAGLPGAMVTVITAVYLITIVKTDPFIVGCFVNGSTILSMLVTYYAGRGHIDRRSPVIIALISLGLGAVGVLLLLQVALSLWVLVPIALVRAAASLLMPAMFMFDEKYRPAVHDAGAGMYTTRLIISIVWIVGPPLAFYVYWLGAIEAVVLVSVSISMLAALAVGIAAVKFSASDYGPVSKPSPSPVSAPQTLAPALHLSTPIIFVIMVCVTGANVLQAISLPLYMLEDLHTATYWPGWNMALAASTEVVAIYFIPKLLRKVSEETILFWGLAFGGIYFALLFVVRTEIPILGLQVLYGAHFALSTVVCLGILKNASTKKIGSITAQFINAGKMGGLLGTTLFGLFAGWLGYGSTITYLCFGLIGCALLFRLIPQGTQRDI